MTPKSLIVSFVSLATVLCGGTVPVTAEEEPAEGNRTPPRLSMVDGDVSYWRPGKDDWVSAHVNIPLAPGDALSTEARANLELQIGARAFVRAGELTQLRFDDQDDGFLQLSVTAGHLALDVRALPAEQTIEIDTPSAAVIVDQEGYYRLYVSEETTTVSARRGGRATIRPAQGEAITLDAGERVVLNGTEAPSVRVSAAPDPDVWDRWNYDRTDEILSAKSSRYVSEDVYGLDTLDRYGSWQEEPQYGWVWAPTSVAPQWTPYSAGRWSYDPYYGWTWLDDAPWGWAPFHYGRWVHVRNYWGWAPGPFVVRPYYSPALVAFFGGGGFGVHVGFGTPFVSWVALGWGEPLLPWWGGAGFIGRPCWHGWGGPRHVRNHYRINVYENARVHNAVLAVDRNHFGHGRPGPRRIGAADVERLSPVRGRLPVSPSAASLAPGQQPGRRPPARSIERSVVSTRRPHDPATQLRAAGIRSRAAHKEPSRRLVDTGSAARPGTRQSDSLERARQRQSDSLERVRGWRERQQEVPARATAPTRGEPQRPDSSTRVEPPPRRGRQLESRRPSEGQPDATAPQPNRRGSYSVVTRPPAARRRAESVDTPSGEPGGSERAPGEPPRRSSPRGRARAELSAPEVGDGMPERRALPSNAPPPRRERERSNEPSHVREGMRSRPSFHGSDEGGAMPQRHETVPRAERPAIQRAPSVAAPRPVMPQRMERPQGSFRSSPGMQGGQGGTQGQGRGGGRGGR